MPRFFFSFTNGEQTALDREGEVLRDEAAAREHAVEDARYLLQYSTTGMSAERGWRVEVSDEQGRVLFVIPFSEVAETGKTDLLPRDE